MCERTHDGHEKIHCRAKYAPRFCAQSSQPGGLGLRTGVPSAETPRWQWLAEIVGLRVDWQACGAAEEFPLQGSCCDQAPGRWSAGTQMALESLPLGEALCPTNARPPRGHSRMPCASLPARRAARLWPSSWMSTVTSKTGPYRSEAHASVARFQGD